MSRNSYDEQEEADSYMLHWVLSYIGGSRYNSMVAKS